MYHRRNEIIVSRDCPAVSIPYGDPVTIQEGCVAQITQQLGNSITVFVEGNLYRVDGADADALGLDSFEEEAVIIPEGEINVETIEETAWKQLRTCYDPEIPVDIVELGLVYRCDVSETEPGKFKIEIDMTLTAPGCGMGTIIADEAQAKVKAIQGVEEVTVDLVWDPPWSREMMGERARLELGLL